jgi:hypothetical protein
MTLIVRKIVYVIEKRIRQRQTGAVNKRVFENTTYMRISNVLG